MSEQTDWGKHGVIAAWVIGVPTLILAVIAYIRPPDPAHPTSFDSWSRPVSVPPWLATLTILLAIIVSALVARWLTKKHDLHALSASASSIRPAMATPVSLQMHPITRSASQFATGKYLLHSEIETFLGKQIRPSYPCFAPPLVDKRN
jgi:hypothetical protein